MKRLIFEVNSSEASKVVSCSVSLMLTLNWGIDTLFEKLTSEIGVWIWKTPFAQYAFGSGDLMQGLTF